MNWYLFPKKEGEKNKMNKQTTKSKNLGEDMLRFVIKLYELQEHIKISCTIKN